VRLGDVPDALIVASHLRRAYGGRTALDDFSLEVPRGSTFGLLGPNGSGKSTFVAMLAAMEDPAAGELRVFGEPPSRRLLSRVGVVFQENAIDPLMRVREYLDFAGRLFGMRPREIRTRSEGLLERFGLAGRANDRAGALSGGMRRRLEVVRAMLHRPELLILDEPTTGIDADEREILWNTLRSADDGLTVLLATNDLAEADRVCSTVAFMRAGRIVAIGTPRELKSALRSESVRVEFDRTADELLPRLSVVAGGDGVTTDGTVAVVTTDDAAAYVRDLFTTLPQGIRSVRISGATLEDAYFQYVGRRAGGEPK
jgi:ABC-2 type transport system ATP-binding protein